MENLLSSDTPPAPEDSEGFHTPTTPSGDESLFATSAVSRFSNPITSVVKDLTFDTDEDEGKNNWNEMLDFDFNCSQELFEAICEIDERDLSLREAVLKRVFERERAAKLREELLLAQISDLEERLAIAQKNKQPLMVAPSSWKESPYAKDRENTRPSILTAKKLKDTETPKASPIRERNTKVSEHAVSNDALNLL